MIIILIWIAWLFNLVFTERNSRDWSSLKSLVIFRAERLPRQLSSKDQAFVSARVLHLCAESNDDTARLQEPGVCYSFETNAWQDCTRVASLQGMWYRKTPSLMRSSVISNYWTAGFGRLVLTRRNYDILDFLLDAVAGIFCVFQFLLHGFVVEMSY